MKKVLLTLAALAFSASSHAVLMTEVSDNAYITVEGYDIAWVAPVSQNPSYYWQPVDYSYQSQFGWAPITEEIYNIIGGLDAFDFTGVGYNAAWNGSSHRDNDSGARASGSGLAAGLSIAVATPWFSNQHFHIDFSQAIGGNAWSGLDFEGSSCPSACNESLAYRISGSAVAVPAPATLLLLGLGLLSLGFTRRKSV
ncbi:MAG: PEP-CTERM sorting domain-containing protein [Pseudomonadota bacterium]